MNGIKIKNVHNQRYKNKYRIKSARLEDWDYSKHGGYFVTVCVKKKGCLLGKIINEEMILSKQGEIVKNVG